MIGTFDGLKYRTDRVCDSLSCCDIDPGIIRALHDERWRFDGCAQFQNVVRIGIVELFLQPRRIDAEFLTGACAGCGGVSIVEHFALCIF